MAPATWKVRPRGIATVTGLELKQRIRSKRWYVALILWFFFTVGLALTVFLGASVLGGNPGEGGLWQRTGVIVFTMVTFSTVFALLLVLPAMSAGSINGERTGGTLATLQASLLSPAEIVAGKILASWITGMVFVVLAFPVIAGSGLVSGSGVLYLLRVFLTLAILSFFIVAVGVGLSSLTQRQLGSVVLAYLMVTGATMILPVFFAFSVPLLMMEREVTAHHMEYLSDPYTSSNPGAGDRGDYCVEEKRRVEVPLTEVTAPLLYLNPIVIVSAASPAIPDEYGGANPPLGGDDFQRVDGLQLVREGVSMAGNPTHPSLHNSCYEGALDQDGNPVEIPALPRTFTWLWGVLIWALAAVGSFVVATLRVRAPHGRLPKGQRIA